MFKENKDKRSTITCKYLSPKAGYQTGESTYFELGQQMLFMPNTVLYLISKKNQRVY